MTGQDKVFQSALKCVKLDGLLLEFGVYKGKSIKKISKAFPNNIVFGFDSFEGLPKEFTTKLPKGHFSLSGEIPKVPKNVTIIKGIFQDTLPEFLKEMKQDVAFINFDADLYWSTKFVLDILKDRIVPRTILYFDELIHPEFDGEFRAFVESGIKVVLLDYYMNEENHWSSFAFEVV